MEPAVLSTKVSGFKAEKQGWEGSWGKEGQSQEPPTETVGREASLGLEG